MKKLCTLFLALALSLGLAVPAWAATFSDVSETHWARPFVEEVSEAGIMKGTGNGQFSPDGTMTAAEFAAMLARGPGGKHGSGARRFPLVAGPGADHLPAGRVQEHLH